MSDIALYDTTLRDGTQYEGISLSVKDKIAITQKLDELGIHYIEGGWPGSNPKDEEFFEIIRDVELKTATMVAFGSTRKANIAASEDLNLKALLDANTSVITLVGKCWDLHVTRVLETSLEENLSMISDSISYLKQQGRRVFFDAEHFFDGFKENPEYALQAIKAAEIGGAECVILCDTNGGGLPGTVSKVMQQVKEELSVPLGIHTHNDADMAVSTALAAVGAGATQVQGTINGYGERCGNANLISLIANLKLKMGIDCISDDQLGQLTNISKYVAELANMPHITSQPYVGTSAFAHKGGLHASAVPKVEPSYQHLSPQTLRNEKRVLVSELSGRGNILWKIQELGLDSKITKSMAVALVEEIKQRENQGFQYEGAEASFELLVRRMEEDYLPPFVLEDFMSIVERKRSKEKEDNLSSQVMLKVRVNEEILHTASEGNGPGNALDNALRKALFQFYPSLSVVRLVDYKVRVVDQNNSTGAIVRVLIESTDGESTWSTIGASENVIEASWLALSDSLEYWLVRNRNQIISISNTV